MKILCFVVFFIYGFVFLTFPKNSIEIDLDKSQIFFSSPLLAKLNIEGNFSFYLTNKKEFLKLELEGSCISIDKNYLDWIKLDIVNRGKEFFLNYFDSPFFSLKGKIDFKKSEIFLDVIIRSYNLKYGLLESLTKGKVSIWGKFQEPMISGYLELEGGAYETLEFLSAYFNFLGSYPIIEIMDSKIVLKDGNIYKISGRINLKDIVSLLKNLEFASSKINIDGWEIFLKERKTGIVKKINEKFDLIFDAQDSYGDSGTELHYNLEKDKILKLRMQDNETILGFEHRKEF